MSFCPLAMNSSPDVIDTINSFPVAQIAGRTVFMRHIAHVHDGFQVQTNSVSVDGTPGALITTRKTGGVSTLAVIDGVRAALTDIRKVMPAGVTIKPLFDQSIFVNAALSSVKMGGLMAAGLAALMILLFLGNWRLTLIILAAIPLSIITALLMLYAGGQTLNTMTLGGFALAVGILVDNSTVVIENIERHLTLGEPLAEAIAQGCGEVAVPTMLATLCICIVFVSVFLLQGTAKYLFSPLSLSVCLALLASLALSFTMVPVLFMYLMRSRAASAHREIPVGTAPDIKRHPFMHAHIKFNEKFEQLREGYRGLLAWTLVESRRTVLFFAFLMVGSLLLFPLLGRDFFPQVDAGQFRLHLRAPAGTRLEQTQADFAQVESHLRTLAGAGQIDTILDNIGLPYSGMNIALSDSATVGPMDGEILVSLKEHHRPTPELVRRLRLDLPRQLPSMQFFFQPADIVDQVLNFGQPAPIDVRISGPDSHAA
jgi:multidrug efflux pump subunit AcrB